MRVVARGTFAGETVEVSWSAEDWVKGPGPVVHALIHKAAEIIGTPVGIPDVDILYHSYLDHSHGFAYVAALVLQDFEFAWPDGEPEEADYPEGAVA